MASTVALRSVLVLFCLYCFCHTVHATQSGDEDTGYVPSGYFYIFANKAIHVIDPATQTLVKTILKDQDGRPLVWGDATNVYKPPTGTVATASVPSSANASDAPSRTWNDAVYLEDLEDGYFYVFVNEGDVYTSANGSTYSYVTVIDTLQQEIVARVKVGPRPVHSYAVSEHGEFWTHADGTATFDVIKIANASNLADVNIPGLVKKSGHGKLLVHESLYPLALGTNVAEQYVYQFDLLKRQRINAFPFNASIANASQCIGTHSIVYSNVSSHAYIECTGGGGVLEWDTLANKLVYQWVNQTGSVTNSPDGSIISVVGKGNTSFILAPTENGKKAELLGAVNTPGGGNAPAYFQNATDTYVYFPLSGNVNTDNRAAAAAAGLSSDNAAYTATPADCRYAPANASNSAVGLQLARNSSGGYVTPLCGACGAVAAGADKYDVNATGVRWVSQTALKQAGKTAVTAALLPAGGVRPVANPAGAAANQCSFGSKYRKIKRGGKYLVTLADLPQPSAYVIDGSTHTVVGFVPTSKQPTSLAYAPNRAYTQLN